ncbi:MAG TPA: spore coat protein CotH, partial [Ruminococcaceae bacterium]|nr:spore coat protein CotH [Oscillospiraceae bacterium]
MSTGKHIDKICIAVVAVTLVITILFMCGSSIGIAIADRVVKYESTIFDTSYVHSIDIVMDDWDTFIENCESEEYSPCTVVVDGGKYANVAIRAKGNTSLSNVRSLGSQRYSFKLEFDHYEDSISLDGLDKLCLNNLIQDNTMMKDYLSYQLMSDFGVDSPLCSYAYLTVNGEDWGLYLAVEGIEDSFLSRNYGSDSGELYKPDSLSFGGGRGNGKNFNMDDFDFDSIETPDSDSETDGSARQGGFSGGFDPGTELPEDFDFGNAMTGGATESSEDNGDNLNGGSAGSSEGFGGKTGGGRGSMP